MALLIDAKSERAATWYREDAPLSLILPLATIAAAMKILCELMKQRLTAAREHASSAAMTE